MSEQSKRCDKSKCCKGCKKDSQKKSVVSWILSWIKKSG